MKLIYVAGPISAPTADEREANIDKGRQAGIAIWKLGHVPFVPHLASLGMSLEHHIPASDIYLGDLIVLERCDAMLRLEGWETSRGVEYETAWSQHKQIPIFDSIEELATWLKA